jgi:predicted GIY-YIG superfamily endonuclease
MPYYVYILRCSDGSFYVGSSQDVEQRIKAHNDGKATHYTRSRRPVILVYSEKWESKITAIRRERQIKKWSRSKKEALVSGDRERLKKLSKSRD